MAVNPRQLLVDFIGLQATPTTIGSAVQGAVQSGSYSAAGLGVAALSGTSSILGATPAPSPPQQPGPTPGTRLPSLSRASPVAPEYQAWLDKLTILERFNGRTFQQVPVAANGDVWEWAA
jgi:hypothetical protein